MNRLTIECIKEWPKSLKMKSKIKTVVYEDGKPLNND